LFPIFAIGDMEPNDDLATAEMIIPGSYSGTVNGTNKGDYYKFSITPGDLIMVSFTGSDSDLTMMIVDADENVKSQDTATVSMSKTIKFQTSHETEYTTWYILAETSIIWFHIRTHFLGRCRVGTGRPSDLGRCDRGYGGDLHRKRYTGPGG
ncbi:MAG: hypothetical protein MUC62_06685, partial [Candidatus Thermoplasmatota archaeon]|nr:hypothetical protein [Candidatus Thermoplasmatota archaeon]